MVVQGQGAYPTALSAAPTLLEESSRKGGGATAKQGASRQQQEEPSRTPMFLPVPPLRPNSQHTSSPEDAHITQNQNASSFTRTSSNTYAAAFRRRSSVMFDMLRRSSVAELFSSPPHETLQRLTEFIRKADSTLRATGKVWRSSLTADDLHTLRLIQIFFFGNHVLPVVYYYLFDKQPKFPATISHNLRNGWPKLMNHVFFFMAWLYLMPFVGRRIEVDQLLAMSRSKKEVTGRGGASSSTRTPSFAEYCRSAVAFMAAMRTYLSSKMKDLATTSSQRMLADDRNFYQEDSVSEQNFPGAAPARPSNDSVASLRSNRGVCLRLRDLVSLSSSSLSDVTDPESECTHTTVDHGEGHDEEEIEEHKNVNVNNHPRSAAALLSSPCGSDATRRQTTRDHIAEHEVDEETVKKGESGEEAATNSTTSSSTKPEQQEQIVDQQQLQQDQEATKAFAEKWKNVFADCLLDSDPEVAHKLASSFVDKVAKVYSVFLALRRGGMKDGTTSRIAELKKLLLEEDPPSALHTSASIPPATSGPASASIPPATSGPVQDKTQLLRTTTTAPQSSPLLQEHLDRLRSARVQFARMILACSFLCLAVFRLGGGRRWGKVPLHVWNMFHYFFAGGYMTTLHLSSLYVWSQTPFYRRWFVLSAAGLATSITWMSAIKARIGMDPLDEEYGFHVLIRDRMLLSAGAGGGSPSNQIIPGGAAFLRRQLRLLWWVELLVQLSENSLFIAFVAGLRSGLKEHCVNVEPVDLEKRKNKNDHLKLVVEGKRLEKGASE
ncbi:unnamed protein product [Amoebophrya sp. A25]|nr:unnamed protein product [Amoebophrya sp. A25]|eukprot:GSA25T00025892001.1